MKKKMGKIMFIASILLLIISIFMITIGFIKDMVLFVMFGVIYLLVGVISLKSTYPGFITTNRKQNWRYKQLTAEELEMVEDAKKLIECVDENIVISSFNVYKVKFLLHGWFYYDEDTQELSIFLPFKRFMKFGKDFCFLTVVHEILHSQNLKRNLRIFDNKFLEGLNQLLTIWLIENYSEKYKIPKTICIATLKLGKGRKLKVNVEYKIYDKEISMVKDILDKSDIDLREIFINYIDSKPEFFKSFVPLKYFTKQ